MLILMLLSFFLSVVSAISLFTTRRQISLKLLKHLYQKYKLHIIYVVIISDIFLCAFKINNKLLLTTFITKLTNYQVT